MALYVSTGARQSLLKGDSLRDMFNRNTALIKVYSGAAPATADAAATGTLLVTISAASATAGTKQKVRFTPTAGDATTNTWTITLNGVAHSFVDSGSLSPTQICTGLYNLIGAGNGSAITTPAGTINIPQLNARFALTDNTGTLDIEAATLGMSFEYTATVSGGGTGSWTTAVQAAHAGLDFELASDVASGIIEKLSSQTWSGVAGATGTAGYFRLVQYADTAALSTSQIRLQGTVNTSNADLNMSKVNVVTGETHTITTFSITAPAT